MPVPAFTPDDLPDLTDRTILATGGNVGLGYQSILAFLKKGAKVYMASRTESKAMAAIKTLKTQVPGARIEFIHLDLQFRLHVLLNNAGVLAQLYMLTEDGYEVQFGTNYMGHFLLTKLLTPLLIKTAQPAPVDSVRVVNVSSIGHNLALGYGLDLEDFRHGWNPLGTWVRYGVSKLANILHTISLAPHLRPHGVVVVALHPGLVTSDIWNTAASWNILTRGLWAVVRQVFTSVEEGAYTQIYCAASEKLTVEDAGSHPIPVATKGLGFWGVSGYAKNEDLAGRLRSWSEKEVGETWISERGLLLMGDLVCFLMWMILTVGTISVEAGVGVGPAFHSQDLRKENFSPERPHRVIICDQDIV